MMSINARAYVLSGKHPWLAVLSHGQHFAGLYTMSRPPRLTVARRMECLEFWVWDLSGQLRCTLPTHVLPHARESEFRPQRLYIDGYAESEGMDLVARIKQIEPVRVIW